MRLLAKISLGFFFLMMLSVLAHAESERYSVITSFKVHEAGGDKELELSSGFKYAITEMNRRETHLHVYGPDGREVPGDFVILAADLERVRTEDITASLQAVQKGTRPVEFPTCQVSEPPKVEPLPKVEPPAKPAGPLVVKKEPPAVKQEPLKQGLTGPKKWCDAYARFKGKVPDAPLKQALYYLSREPNFKDKRGQGVPSRTVQKQRYLSIADYSQSSAKERFYLLDLETGEIKQEKVAHGVGGTREKLQNCGGVGSNKSRAGFYRVENLYYSDHGSFKSWASLAKGKNGIRLQGLTPGNNWDDLNGGGVVMHEAPNYVNAKVGDSLGRSNGCPAFAEGHLKAMKDKITGGTLFYSYAPVCKSQHSNVMKQLPGWEGFCN